MNKEQLSKLMKWQFIIGSLIIVFSLTFLIVSFLIQNPIDIYQFMHILLIIGFFNYLALFMEWIQLEVS